MFNINALRWWCNTPESTIFNRVGETTETSIGRYSFIDRNSSVLAVAHLDTALTMTKFHVDKHNVFSPSLDDRLGAYIIVDVLPKLGINVDVLLTEGEEVARSTSLMFESMKQYNWIVSFDRMGDDVVMYNYESEEMEDLLFDHGFKTGWGSFSDICWLEHLGCKAFNIGVGYHKQHSSQCQADLRVTKKQLQKFKVMHEKLNDMYLSHSEFDYKSSIKKWKKFEVDEYKWWDDDEEVIEWDGSLFAVYDYEKEKVKRIIDDIELRCDYTDVDELWEYYIGDASMKDDYLMDVEVESYENLVQWPEPPMI
jgi:hypothetical protein